MVRMLGVRLVTTPERVKVRVELLANRLMMG
jgi:hypothetical protein